MESKNCPPCFLKESMCYYSKNGNSLNDAFLAVIDPVSSKIDLFKELNEKLHFPYFGFNWDSLDELLRDFFWIRQKKIIIVHNSLCLSPRDYNIYMSIVNSSERFWLNYPDEHILKFHGISTIRGTDSVLISK